MVATMGYDLLRGAGFLPKTRALRPSAHRTQVAWALQYRPLNSCRP
jgi:hypothetical protein